MFLEWFQSQLMTEKNLQDVEKLETAAQLMRFWKSVISSSNFLLEAAH